jgi:hypothetical protein
MANKKFRSILSALMAMIIVALLFAVLYYLNGKINMGLSFRIQEENLLANKVSVLLYFINRHSDVECASYHFDSYLFGKEDSDDQCSCDKQYLSIKQKQILEKYLMRILKTSSPEKYEILQFESKWQDEMHPFFFFKFNDSALKSAWIHYYLSLYTEIKNYNSFTIQSMNFAKPQFSELDPLGGPVRSFGNSSLSMSEFINLEFVRISLYKEEIQPLDNLTLNSSAQDQIFICGQAGEDAFFSCKYNNEIHPIDELRTALFRSTRFRFSGLNPEQLCIYSDPSVGVVSFSDYVYYSLLIIASFGNSDVEPKSELVRWLMLFEIYIGLIIVGYLITIVVSQAPQTQEGEREKTILKKTKRAKQNKQ